MGIGSRQENYSILHSIFTHFKINEYYTIKFKTFFKRIGTHNKINNSEPELTIF